jgi:hypothetical protein
MPSSAKRVATNRSGSAYRSYSGSTRMAELVDCLSSPAILARRQRQNGRVEHVPPT